jgi:hypothetical protein
MRQIATLLENVKELPVQRLKDEMKELQVGFPADCPSTIILFYWFKQDRQARIENLLLLLTRGMRNEVPHRQGTN